MDGSLESRRLGAGPQRNGRAVCGAKRTGRSSSGPGVCMNYAGYGTDHLGQGRCKFHGGSTATHRVSAVAAEVRHRMAHYGSPVEVDPMTALVTELHRTAGHVAWTNLQLQDHPDPKSTDARVLLSLYQREREHLVRVSKVALDSGVAEREVRVAEGQARLLVGVIEVVLRELRLNAHELREARQVVGRELRRLGEAAPDD